jgi:hypothetical protein
MECNWLDISQGSVFIQLSASKQRYQTSSMGGFELVELYFVCLFCGWMLNDIQKELAQLKTLIRLANNNTSQAA